MIVDPGTGGVLSCVLETETQSGTRLINKRLDQEQSQIKESRQITRADNKRDPEGTIMEINDPRNNNFSTNAGNFPEHYIFLTQIR